MRQARHDMRHHFHTLQGFAAQGNLDGIAAYLDEVQGVILEGDLGLCENPAVDSVTGYFAMRYREHGIPLTFSLDLLPVPESELCSVLSNLLENAMESGVKTAPGRRQTKVAAHLYSGHMVLLSVENTYNGKVREKDGMFLSSKRPGDGVFTANVMLRGGMGTGGMSVE